jgi:hypothetical protein
VSYTIPVAVLNERVKELTKLWERSFPLGAPDDTQFRTWLSSHSFLTVAYGLSEASQAFCRFKGALTVQEVIKYASKVMVSRTKILKTLKTEREKLCRQAMNN